MAGSDSGASILELASGKTVLQYRRSSYVMEAGAVVLEWTIRLHVLQDCVCMMVSLLHDHSTLLK